MEPTVCLHLHINLTNRTLPVLMFLKTGFIMSLYLYFDVHSMKHLNVSLQFKANYAIHVSFVAFNSN